jgi:hypothetical protein
VQPPVKKNDTLTYRDGQLTVKLPRAKICL